MIFYNIQIDLLNEHKKHFIPDILFNYVILLRVPFCTMTVKLFLLTRILCFQDNSLVLFYALKKHLSGNIKAVERFAYSSSGRPSVVFPGKETIYNRLSTVDQLYRHSMEVLLSFKVKKKFKDTNQLKNYIITAMLSKTCEGITNLVLVQIFWLTVCPHDKECRLYLLFYKVFLHFYIFCST